MAGTIDKPMMAAAPAVLEGGLEAIAGFQAVARSCLDALLALTPLVIARGDVEDVHQARVALRRLRAVLRLFRQLTDDGEAAVLRAELKAAAAALGAVRDIDVLIERIEAAASPTGTDAAGTDMADILARLHERREAAQARLSTMLGGGAFQHFVAQLERWIESGAWTGSAIAHEPVADLVARRFDRWWRRLRRTTRDLSDLDEADIHDLRIEAKTFRYAAAFVPAMDGKSGRKDRAAFLKTLGRLQESLGVLHDLHVALHVSGAGHGDLFEGLDPIAAAGMQARLTTLLARGHKAQRKRALCAAQKALDKLHRLKAWWRP